MSPSCGEPVLQPGGGGGHAAPTSEAALHPRPHHGPRRLRHHVFPGDQCHQQTRYHFCSGSPPNANSDKPWIRCSNTLHQVRWAV